MSEIDERLNIERNITRLEIELAEWRQRHRELPSGDGAISYPDQPERLVRVSDFYRLKEKDDLNLKYEFWHDVSLLLQRYYLRRDRQARKFASRLRLMQRTAAEIDARYREQIEYWKVECWKAKHKGSSSQD